MSPRRRNSSRRPFRKNAPVFAALGDETRLAILSTLGTGPACSITRLSRGSPVSRQAITKHLLVLQDAGLVRSVRHGRERLFELSPASLEDARRALEQIAAQWDETLGRLKAFVERDGGRTPG